VILQVWSRTFTSSGTLAMPSNLAFPPAVWSTGPGGTGASGIASHDGGAGGGGGATGGEPALAGVAPGTVLTITVGAPGTGNPTTVAGGAVTVQGNAGANGTGTGAGAAGGTAGSNTVAFAGGPGGAGVVAASGSRSGGGGGGSAGAAGAGGAGAAGGLSSSAGGTAGTGTPAGAAGGACPVGMAATAPGSPGGGGAGESGTAGGTFAGTGGRAVITWVTWLPDGAVRGHVPARRTGSARGSTGAPVQASGPVTPALFTQPRKALRGSAAARKGSSAGSAGAPVMAQPAASPAPFAAPHSAVRGRPGARKGSSSGSTGAPVTPPVAAVVNQWSGTFAQPAVFGPMPPALQSTVIALTPASSVGGGTGTPTPGNWLFCVQGWQQEAGAAQPVTVSVTDDIHSWWRPVPPSSGAGVTRTACWYTPNIVRQAGDVYVAPNGCIAGAAVLVAEVSGIGPWDEVAGTYTSFASAATALNLALAAPGAEVFILAAVCGDSTAASQAFTPPGWTPLAAVTASNGVNHSGDAVLTSACITTSSAVSVNASASTENLSGIVISVLADAPSPIPAGVNPAWPGRTIVEIGLGSGFLTPPDQIAWTVVNDSAADPRTAVKRFWAYQETTGIQYALGQIQSTDGAIQLDNFDGALSPSNSGSPFFPGVATGVPVRARFALGGSENRWLALQRHLTTVRELRSAALRNYVSAGISDAWSIASGACWTPYRGEVAQDSPHTWYPCDDQALVGGVLPVTLRNAAPGNSIPLSIVASPAGIPYQDMWGMENGVYGLSSDLTAGGTSSTPAPVPGIAVYAVGQSAGWMYGDPQSSPASGVAGGAVTASPGSAAWQQTGLLGSTGSHGWFLAARDPGYPPLSGGVSVEGWFSPGFLGGAQGLSFGGTQFYDVCAQPYCPLTLIELATDTAPVAILQIANPSGDLVLITYNGATATSHTIYSASDLRCSTWFSVTLSLTQTTWNVQLNGGLTANVSGTATGMTSAWTWLVADGDLGAGGGSALSGIQHSGNMQVSHLSVYPRVLPEYRVLSHYYAAITGAGLLPAPSSVALSAVMNQAPTGFTPDGALNQGNYGTGATIYSMSLVAAAVAGAYTSGPSARQVLAGIGFGGAGSFGAAVWAAAQALAPGVELYTSANAGAEKQAATILGTGNAFSAGYGSGATGSGVCQTSPGTNATPPATASALGDTVASRIERICGYGSLPVLRSIDQASLPVQAALDAGGQQAGQGISNIAQSDSGLLSIDNMGSLCYRDRAHLAADTPVWQLGPDVAAGQVPFARDAAFTTDPQKVFNAIGITPYDPSGATPPLITPSSASAVAASIAQYGPRPKTFTSYLQSQGEIQDQADWYLATFGKNVRRVAVLSVDAAAHPAAWPYVLGANIGDVIAVTDSSLSGAPTTTGSYRITQMSRNISGGANGTKTTGTLRIVADPLPASYWT
jgi:hypothetical protein